MLKLCLRNMDCRGMVIVVRVLVLTRRRRLAGELMREKIAQIKHPKVGVQTRSLD